MTSDRKALLALPGVVALAALAAGCGNYSNEDLEFMNALPDRGALEASIPPSALTSIEEADLAASTHETTHTFNGLVAALVGLVDTIRSYPPTSRTPTSRIWGPYPADRRKLRNLDWQTRMIVSRSSIVTNRFDYEIAVHREHTADTLWHVFVRGWFMGGQVARRGVGHVELVTGNVRPAGLDVSDLGLLDHLEIEYDTVDNPIWIQVTSTNLALGLQPPDKIAFDYKATAEGQGQMSFDLFADVVPMIPNGVQEHVNITSRWLPSGAGGATATVVSGDAAGTVIQTQCWDRTFRPTFNDKPFGLPEEQRPGDPTDPAICPDISPF